MKWAKDNSCLFLNSYYGILHSCQTSRSNWQVEDPLALWCTFFSQVLASACKWLILSASDKPLLQSLIKKTLEQLCIVHLSSCAFVEQERLYL